jgi:K+-transporting ATPase ATPase C chain
MEFMKTNIIQATLLTLCCIVFFCGVYTAVVWGIAQFSPNSGKGEIINYSASNGSIKYGYANVGQSFTANKYFWSRPSAANYNAAGSAGSNKGPSNPDYLKQVKATVDTFLVHNPSVKKSDIPAEMVTASGSGLDPDISPAAAYVQVLRISKVRGVQKEKIQKLIEQMTVKPLLGFFGPERVNVLKINIELDKLK